MSHRDVSFAAASWKGIVTGEVGTSAGCSEAGKCRGRTDNESGMHAGRTDDRQGRQLKMMSCDEFEVHGLDIERVDADPLQAAAAAEHVKFCPHCSAMSEPWREGQRDLSLVRGGAQGDS